MISSFPDCQEQCDSGARMAGPHCRIVSYFFPGGQGLEVLLEEAKPGGFQTGGFPIFFGKGPDCVADPFGTVPRRCS